jgi:hypothetical protein
MVRRQGVADALSEFAEELLRMRGTVTCDGGLVVSRHNAGWLVGGEVANVVEPDEQRRCYLALVRGRDDMHFVRPYLVCLTTPRGVLYAVDAYNRRVYRLAGDGAVCEMYQFLEHSTSLFDAAPDGVAALRAALCKYVACGETSAYARMYLGLLVGVFDFALARRAGASAGPPHLTLERAGRDDAREMVARAMLVVGQSRPVVDALFEGDDDDPDYYYGCVSERVVALVAGSVVRRRRVHAQHHARLCLDLLDQLVPAGPRLGAV